MSRALAASVLCALCLGGCVAPPATPPPVPVIRENPVAALQQWFGMEKHVAQMSAEDAVASLVEMGRPQTPDTLFLFALLNQQLGSYGGMTLARDALQQLEEDTALLIEQQRLASILRRYNQARINSHLGNQQASERQAELEAQLQLAQEQRVLLEQKIQALTDLEADISTRKEESPGAGSITPR